MWKLLGYGNWVIFIYYLARTKIQKAKTDNATGAWRISEKQKDLQMQFTELKSSFTPIF